MHMPSQQSWVFSRGMDQSAFLSTSDLVDGEARVIPDSESAGGIGRRRLVKWGGLGAVGAVAAVPLVSTGISHAATTSVPPDQIPPDTLPGGAYDRYVAQL